MTLPARLVEDIDRLERNRSRFITEAVEHELARRQREALLQSLKMPHPEATELADAGMEEWGGRLAEDDEGLVDIGAGTGVRWVEGTGWIEEPK